jgi:uncharacterized protein (TIGR00251 family)
MNILKLQCFNKSSVTKMGEKFFLTIYAKPNSKKVGVTEINEECISISINAPPVEGKANTAIVEFLSDALGLSKSRVQLERGSKNKNKVVSIIDSDYTSAEQIINQLKKHLIYLFLFIFD